MKEVKKYLGVIIIFIAVVLLGYAVINRLNNNDLLLISLILIAVGFFGEIFLFRKFSN